MFFRVRTDRKVKAVKVPFVIRIDPVFLLDARPAEVRRLVSFVLKENDVIKLTPGSEPIAEWTEAACGLFESCMKWIAICALGYAVSILAVLA